MASPIEAKEGRSLRLRSGNGRAAHGGAGTGVERWLSGVEATAQPLLTLTRKIFWIPDQVQDDGYISKFQIPNPKSQIPNSKSQIPNSKFQITNCC